MRQDRIFARIFLIFSIANVALTAPAIIQQRHLDVAKATSEKRAPGFDGEETGDLPPESSSPLPPHDRPTDMSRWAWLLWPDSPKSSSAAADRVTTQASGASDSGNGATGDLSPESSSRVPPHDSPKDEWAWLYGGSAPESSSVAPGLGNGATGDLPPEPLLRMAPHGSLPTNEGLNRPSSPESSSSSSDHITIPASGVTTPSSSGSVHMGDQMPGQVSAVAVQSEASSLKGQILFSSGVLGIIGIAYGIHQLVEHLYVFPLLSLLRTSSRVANILTCDLPQ